MVAFKAGFTVYIPSLLSEEAVIFSVLFSLRYSVENIPSIGVADPETSDLDSLYPSMSPVTNNIVQFKIKSIHDSVVNRDDA